MGSVDFVKSDKGNNQSQGNGYDIEYTDPQSEEDITKPKHGNLLSWRQRASVSQSRAAKPQPVTPTARVQSAQMPSTEVTRAAAYQPVNVNKSTAQSAAKIQPAQAQPQPVTVKLTERHLPPPPPPPIHASVPSSSTAGLVHQPVPVAPVVAPIVPPKPAPAPQVVAAQVTVPVPPQPIVPTPPAPVKSVMAPTMPTPVAAPAPRIMPPAPAAPVHTAPAQVKPAPAHVVPAAPITPVPVPLPPARPVQAAGPVMANTAAAGAPMMSQHHATSVGEIVAQNVSNMHGEMTHPTALEPGLTGVNLLPNAIQQPMQQMPLYRLLRSTTLMIMLCTLVYLAMVGYQGFYIWRTHNTLAELTELDNQILTYRQLQTDINGTSDELTAIQELLNDHLYWTQWFSFLERNTLPTVYYSSFSGSANGTMNLQAVAPDYTTISQQIAALRALPEVLAVTVTTAASTETSFAQVTGDTTSAAASNVQFTISLQVDPSILHYQLAGRYEQPQ